MTLTDLKRSVARELRRNSLDDRTETIVSMGWDAIEDNDELLLGNLRKNLEKLESRLGRADLGFGWEV